MRVLYLGPSSMIRFAQISGPHQDILKTWFKSHFKKKSYVYEYVENKIMPRNFHWTLQRNDKNPLSTLHELAIPVVPRAWGTLVVPRLCCARVNWERKQPCTPNFTRNATRENIPAIFSWFHKTLKTGLVSRISNQSHDRPWFHIYMHVSHKADVDAETGSTDADTGETFVCMEASAWVPCVLGWDDRRWRQRFPLNRIISFLAKL